MGQKGKTMFIQASGRNKDGKKISFIATNPEELLKWMKKNGVEKSVVFPGDLSNEVIEIHRLTQEDVERWAQNGEI